MLSMDVRRRVAGDVRDELGAVFFWPETGPGRVAYLAAVPVVLLTAFVVLRVSGVLLLSGVGAVIRVDFLEAVAAWPKGQQAALFIGCAGGVLLLWRVVSGVGGAVLAERQRRDMLRAQGIRHD
jgi:hypothetical protein